MTWQRNLPPHADGGWYGLQLSLHVKPRDWPPELEKLPAEHRARAEAYLRGCAARIRNTRDRDEG